jgi:hypothetical protein
MKEELGVGSKQSIRDIKILEQWTTVKQQIKPLLTPKHMVDQFEFSNARKDSDLFSSAKVPVHIDEQWFYCFRSGRTLHVLSGVEPPALFALSKTQIPKAMFLEAVAPPMKRANSMVKLDCE